MKSKTTVSDLFLLEVELAKTPLFDPKQIELRQIAIIEKMLTSQDSDGALGAELVHLADDLLWSTSVHVRYEWYQRITTTGERLVLLFGSASERHALAGDLEEELKTKITPRHGYVFGIFWYCMQVALFLFSKILQALDAIVSVLKIWK